MGGFLAEGWAPLPALPQLQGHLPRAAPLTPRCPPRPLLAGCPGAGAALLQPPAPQPVQAGQRQGAWVLARRLALLTVRAATLGHQPQPGPIPVSRAQRAGLAPPRSPGLLPTGDPTPHPTPTLAFPGTGTRSPRVRWGTKVCRWAPEPQSEEAVNLGASASSSVEWAHSGRGRVPGDDPRGVGTLRWACQAAAGPSAFQAERVLPGE